MSEALRFPELAKAFYEKGAGRASDRLAEVLEAARDSGEIELYDCHAAADHFVGMFRDNFHLRVLLGLSSPREPAEADAAVTAIVGIFLYGVYNVDRIGEPKARSEEHTSELQSLMRISYAVFCLKNKTRYTYK